MPGMRTWVSVLTLTMLTCTGCCRFCDRWCGPHHVPASSAQPCCVPCCPTYQPAPVCCPTGSSPVGQGQWQRAYSAPVDGCR